jgi:DHA2 family metal-tetracycline-proton antiporter-like MFS transporter
MWILVAGFLLLALFARRIVRAKHPFMDPGLFRNTLYRNGLLTTALAVGAVFGFFFAVPLMLQQLNGLDAWDIGLVIFPGAFSAAVLGRVGGRLADRIGSIIVVHIGLGLLFTGYLLLAYATGRPAPVIAACLIVTYTGFAFVQASLAKTVSITLVPGHMGVGMGFYNLIFFTSGAFGAAAAGKILDISSHPEALSSAGAAEPYRHLFLFFAAAIGLAAAFFLTSFRRR